MTAGRNLGHWRRSAVRFAPAKCPMSRSCSATAFPPSATASLGRWGRRCTSFPRRRNRIGPCCSTWPGATAASVSISTSATTIAWARSRPPVAARLAAAAGDGGHRLGCGAADKSAAASGRVSLVGRLDSPRPTCLNYQFAGQQPRDADVRNRRHCAGRGLAPAASLGSKKLDDSCFHAERNRQEIIALGKEFQMCHAADFAPGAGNAATVFAVPRRAAEFVRRKCSRHTWCRPCGKRQRIAAIRGHAAAGTSGQNARLDPHVGRTPGLVGDQLPPFPGLSKSRAGPARLPASHDSGAGRIL